MIINIWLLLSRSNKSKDFILYMLYQFSMDEFCSECLIFLNIQNILQTKDIQDIIRIVETLLAIMHSTPVKPVRGRIRNGQVHTDVIK